MELEGPVNAKKGVETAEFKTHQVHNDTLCLPRPARLPVECVQNGPSESTAGGSGDLPWDLQQSAAASARLPFKRSRPPKPRSLSGCS